MPIPLSLGADQLVSEQGWGYEVFYPLATSWIKPYSRKARYSHISSHVLKPVFRKDCRRMEETVFDRYTEISAKDHERQRRGGIGSNTFNLDLNSPLSSREAVIKNKHNKRGLSRLLSTFNLGCGVSVESRDDGVFLHDEADITIISCLFQAADAGRQVVRILSDDSDIFVLLVYWTWRYDLQVRVLCANGEVGWCCP